MAKKHGLSELVKEIGYAGVNSLAETSKKAEALVKKLAKDSGIDLNKSKKALDDFKKKAEDKKKTLEKQVRAQVEKAVKQAPFASKQEVAALKKKIAVLGKPAAKHKRK